MTHDGRTGSDGASCSALRSCVDAKGNVCPISAIDDETSEGAASDPSFGVTSSRCAGADSARCRSVKAGSEVSAESPLSSALAGSASEEASSVSAGPIDGESSRVRGAALSTTTPTRPTCATTTLSASSSRALSISRSRLRSRSRLSARFERISRNLAAETSSRPRSRSRSSEAEAEAEAVVSVEATLRTEGVRVIKLGALALALAGPFELLARLLDEEVVFILLPNQVDLRVAGGGVLSTLDPTPPPLAPLDDAPLAAVAEDEVDPVLACSRHCAKLAPSPARLDDDEAAFLGFRVGSGVALDATTIPPGDD